MNGDEQAQCGGAARDEAVRVKMFARREAHVCCQAMLSAKTRVVGGRAPYE
jgi:hypothetical protein